jgi:uncharacterized NAD-dependent epimerase/dehydratase family protein
LSEGVRGTVGSHPRYLILADGHFDPESSKTATSAVRYLPDRVAAVIDARFRGQTSDEVLGFGPQIPVVGSLEEGLAHEPTALLIGIAPVGGRLPESWKQLVLAAADAGLDLVSGLHTLLADDPDIRARAEERGVAIWDLRRTPENIPVAVGRVRGVDAYTVLTMGTDCNVGKMTTALQVRGVLERQGVATGFAATGQTGILIEGRGIAVDAVKADFIAGAAERLVVESAPGNDVVLVEGQGALTHPGYSGVTLGLLHGSMPDGIILCHQPSRRCIFSETGEYSWVRLLPLPEMIELCERAAAPVKPTRVLGIALMTWDLPEDEARAAVDRAQRETGLPATDPVRFGAEPLAEAILAARSSQDVARLAARGSRLA